MTNLKVLSMTAALALAVAMPSASYAQHRGGGGAIGGGGGFRGGAIAGGGGMRAGPIGGGGFRAGPPGGGAPVVRDSGVVRGPAYAGGNWSGGSGNWSGRHWHGGRHHHRHGGFWPGVGIGFGIGSSYAYYGGGYYDPYYYDDDYYDDSTVAVAGGDAEAYCRRRFKSYDPASGTYLGYDGQRHPCP